jgi:AraC-like DNA-binding protein
VRVFAARCKPEGIAAILPFRLGTAIHKVVPIDEIWGARARALEEALFESRNDRTRINLLESYLRELLKRRDESCVETKFFSLLRANGGATPIGQIALETGADYKRIERSFLRTVGVTPKFYARVLRYQKAAEDLLRAPSDTPWLDAGFSDQAHFIREFSEFTGLSPIRFLKGAQEISRWLLE